MAVETTSAIRGKVVDSTGNPVANASVVVLDERTGSTRTFSSNDAGNFYAARLPVGGPYKITVNGARTMRVQQIVLGDVYNLTVNMQSGAIEEVVVYGDVSSLDAVTSGPTASFSSYDLETAVAFDRDINEVYSLDPRMNLDQDGFSINCAGKHPRFNSVTLDGVSQNDRFGLNSNGYSTATGMPFPYDAIQQVSVELAPFDVTYGGFTACAINSVTKGGSNTWTGNVFYEYTDDDFRGETISGEPDVKGPAYDEEKYGFTVGGPIIHDKLFFYAAYEKSDEPRFIGQGFSGSGIGTERPWLSQADFNRISQIAKNVYNYDTGGAPSDGVQENEKYSIRVDWNVNDDHSLAFIYNFFDGFQDRSSDGDPDEFEFSNHFYVKGAETETFTVMLDSQWTDSFSTEVFVSLTDLDDLQQTRGPKDFGDFQIDLDGRNNKVYLGADDSRQSNGLNTEADVFRFVGRYLFGDHVITAGYEREDLEVFNIFVQHSKGGEWDFRDSSVGNSAACDALTAQGRFDDPDCGTSGIDKFELGRPSSIDYGSGGGSNDPTDAAATFNNITNSVFVQDEWFLIDYDLTVTFGLRYDWFETDDAPKFNQALTDLYGIRNDEDIDGVDILMPRLGFSWEPSATLSVRGGVGLYSGGNPTVWLSNTFSNDGISNVQTNFRPSSGSILDGTIPLAGTAGPGRAPTQQQFDQVANTTAANGATRRTVLLDPGYDQPSEWKFAIGATYILPWYGIQLDADYMHSEAKDTAIYVDLSQEIVGSTILGQPIYDFTNGSDNLMLTNANDDGNSDVISFILRKNFDFGLDLMLSYAYTQAEDVSPMTSSTAGSNFDNVATLDINNVKAADSNYVVPHRLTFRASYARNFFRDLTTRFTLLGYASEGQPQSYVMSGGDLEGDGFFGRHLLYVPSGPNDPNVVFDPGFDQAAFFAFVDREDLGSGFVDRNETHAQWSYRLDFRFDQELPTFVEGMRGKLFFKIFNLTNLLSDSWGKAKDAEFFSQQVVRASIDDQGRYVYTRFSNRDINDLRENRSLWEARLGIEFSF